LVLEAVEEEAMNKIKIEIRITLIFVILWSLFSLFAQGISPGGSDFVGWLSILSIIFSIAALTLNKWGRLGVIVLLGLHILIYAFEFIRGEIYQAFIILIIPAACLIILLHPKVKEQFR